MRARPSHIAMALALAALQVLALGCKDESGGQGEPDPPSPAEHCGVEGSVETTVFDRFDRDATYIDVPSTALSVDPSFQNLDGDLNWNLIEVGGAGFWSITGSLWWTGKIELEPLLGLETGINHSADIYYGLSTGELGGLVFVPLEREDSQGSFSATLSSQYAGGTRRTKYGFGIRQNYVGRSTDVTVDWRYHAATNELVFESVGELDLGEFDPYEGWVANPIVTVCLSTVDVPPDVPSPVFAGVGVVGLVIVGLVLRRRREEG